MDIDVHVLLAGVTWPLAGPAGSTKNASTGITTLRPAYPTELSNPLTAPRVESHMTVRMASLANRGNQRLQGSAAVDLDPPELDQPPAPANPTDRLAGRIALTNIENVAARPILTPEDPWKELSLDATRVEQDKAPSVTKNVVAKRGSIRWVPSPDLVGDLPEEDGRVEVRNRNSPDALDSRHGCSTVEIKRLSRQVLA